MITHDISRPIPPGTVRISVIHSGDNFTLDLPSGQIGATLQAFDSPLIKSNPGIEGTTYWDSF